jgi:hypothetical protein
MMNDQQREMKTTLYTTAMLLLEASVVFTKHSKLLGQEFADAGCALAFVCSKHAIRAVSASRKIAKFTSQPVTSRGTWLNPLSHSKPECRAQL